MLEAEPAQTTHEALDRGGARGKRALSRCKGGPLLLVKGRIGWRKGRIRLERLRKGPAQMKTASKRGLTWYGGCCSKRWRL